MPGLNPDATWWAESGLHEARKTLRQLQAQIQHYVDTWEVQNDSNSNAMLLIMRPILALVKRIRIIIENVKDYIKEHRGGGRQGGGGKPGKGRGKGRRSAPYLSLIHI